MQVLCCDCVWGVWYRYAEGCLAAYILPADVKLSAWIAVTDGGGGVQGGGHNNEPVGSLIEAFFKQFAFLILNLKK